MAVRIVSIQHTPVRVLRRVQGRGFTTVTLKDVKRIDPLLCDADLAYSGTFYPAGFPLRIATNSPDVLQAAAESWAPFTPEFDTPPVDFRVLVEAEGGTAAEPRFRKQGHLLSFVSDAYSFAVGDALTLSASIHLSQQTAAHHALLRWFFLDAMAYMLLTQRYLVSLHAACVARQGAGILLCGQSASGKSTVSIACARAGFTFVSDDCTRLVAASPDLVAIGKPHQVRFRPDAARHFPELAGYLAAAHPGGKLSIEVPIGLFPDVRTAQCCPIRCLVFLDRTREGAARVEPVSAMDAAERLLADLPSYGDEVNAMHEGAIRRLVALPVWQLSYRAVEDAVRLLSEIRMPPDGSR